MASTTGWTRRRRYLVDRDFQLRFFLTRWLLAIAIASLVVAVATLYLYVFVYAGNRVETAWSGQIQYAVLALLFLCVVFLVRWAIRISHHVSGSMLRLSVEMRKVEAGDLSVRVGTRKRDRTEGVVEMLNRLLQSLEARVAEDRRLAQRAQSELDEVSRLLEAPPLQAEGLAETRRKLAALRAQLPRITAGFILRADGAGEHPPGGLGAELPTP